MSSNQKPSSASPNAVTQGFELDTGQRTADIDTL